MVDSWRRELAGRFRAQGESPSMCGYLVKMQETGPALALIFELVANAHAGRHHEVISVRSTELGLGWADLLEAHARRAYGVEPPAVTGARILLERIRAGAIGPEFTERELERKCWEKLSKDWQRRGSLAVLVEYGWLTAEEHEPGPQGGRPTVRYVAHPSLRGGR